MYVRVYDNADDDHEVVNVCNICKEQGTFFSLYRHMKFSSCCVWFRQYYVHNSDSTAGLVPLLWDLIGNNDEKNLSVLSGNP